MKLFFFISALLATGSSFGSEELSRPPESNLEKIGVRSLKEPTPSCQSGHEAALSNGTLTIKPGDVICVQFQTKGDEIVSFSVVDKGEVKDTLIIHFWQEPNTDEMYLTLHNPLGTFLKYDASILLPSKSEHEYTSSCPVLSRRMGIEQWPQIINELALTNFRSMPESKTMTCE
jgi:hypothetical protein